MNTVATPSRNLQSVRQMQVLANKIAESAARAEALLQSKSSAAVTEGLVAVGLCKQARVQMAVACQNLGLAVESLDVISTNTAEAEKQVSATSAGVAELVQHMINVPPTAIAPSIEAFVAELLIIAAIAVARADEHLKQGEQIAFS